jgi:alkylhydroperoxidase family enzyme
LHAGLPHAYLSADDDQREKVTMSARVPMLSQEDANAAAREVGIRESMAQVNAYRVLLNNPQLAAGVNALLTTLLFTNKTIDVRLRELIIMRIGWVTGSMYEWTQHWRFADAVGIPPEDVVAVRDWRNSDRLTPADRAVLAAVDDTLEHGKISDAVWQECAEHVGGPAELVEMVVAIGNWSMFSQVLRSLEVPLEDGVEGWPPDGQKPASAD